jgi:hypothetical protein
MKDLEAQPVWSKSVCNEEHFTLEDVSVFRAYLPSCCSTVTDTLHFDIPTKPLDAEQDWSQSVSNKGHFTLEDVSVFRALSPLVLQ